MSPPPFFFFRQSVCSSEKNGYTLLCYKVALGVCFPHKYLNLSFLHSDQRGCIQKSFLTSTVASLSILSPGPQGSSAVQENAIKDDPSITTLGAEIHPDGSNVPCCSCSLSLLSAHWTLTGRVIYCSTRLWRSLHKQTFSHYFCWAGQITYVFLWCCWRCIDLLGKTNKQTNQHVTGTSYTDTSNQMVLGCCGYGSVTLQCPIAPHCSAGAVGILAGSKQCCCHHPHVSSSWDSSSLKWLWQKIGGILLVNTAQTAFSRVRRIFPTPGLLSPPSSDFSPLSLENI